MWKKSKIFWKFFHFLLFFIISNYFLEKIRSKNQMYHYCEQNNIKRFNEIKEFLCEKSRYFRPFCSGWPCMRIQNWHLAQKFAFDKKSTILNQFLWDLVKMTNSYMVVILTKSQRNWVKIVNFSIIAYFWAICQFWVLLL